jgi:hypothetical protein
MNSSGAASTQEVLDDATAVGGESISHHQQLPRNMPQRMFREVELIPNRFPHPVLRPYVVPEPAHVEVLFGCLRVREELGSDQASRVP